MQAQTTFYYSDFVGGEQTLTLLDGSWVHDIFLKQPLQLRARSVGQTLYFGK
jgi:hypothetical protein